MLNRMFTAAALASATFAIGGISSAQQAQTTIVGCVYEEADVPGRAPNPAERVGLFEDYILAELSPAEAAKSASVPATVPDIPSATDPASPINSRVEASNG